MTGTDLDLETLPDLGDGEDGGGGGRVDGRGVGDVVGGCHFERGFLDGDFRSVEVRKKFFNDAGVSVSMILEEVFEKVSTE